MIGAGTKIDNLVHIAHNVKIGQFCIFRRADGHCGKCNHREWGYVRGTVRGERSRYDWRWSNGRRTEWRHWQRSGRGNRLRVSGTPSCDQTARMGGDHSDARCPEKNSRTRKAAREAGDKGNRSVNQQTLSQSFTLSGVGIHTGENGKVILHPAEANFGRRFRVGQTEIPARADFVTDTARCTTLGRDGVKISTVEHLLSALAGLRVDNALIEVEGPEIPVLDGSALPFAQAILCGGNCRTRRTCKHDHAQKFG